MSLQTAQIFKEYRSGVAFKQSLGEKGMYNQNRINERFYSGEQWSGAKCGNDRPLVRHNIIKRIGEYKMAQVLLSPFTVSFSADGVPNTVGLRSYLKNTKKDISSNPAFLFSGERDDREINLVMSALSDYQRVTAERVGFTAICEKALKNSYISGSGVVYTYWDDSVKTGLYADELHKSPISGDICCEVLDIENVFFADPYIDDVQKQPFVIIASYRSVEEVRREALSNGIKDLRGIEKSGADDKVLVLTKLFKQSKSGGEATVQCIKVCEHCVIRPQFDTGLHYYPVSLFAWDRRGRLIYGNSEVTYLIPNQIAINRMITANVWSSMTSGMPIMVVNGDTVGENVTNEPGQILRVYGSNEDVSGAVHYVTPPDFSSAFSQNINDLIENTLTQSGVNEAARGDSRLNNATALINLRNAATLPLKLVQSRFFTFIEDISRIWVDFWITHYGNRRIKMVDENGVWYLPFNAERYSNLHILANIDVGTPNSYEPDESIKLLTDLYEKGIITKTQYLKRLPKGIIPKLSELLLEISDDAVKEGNDERI